MRHWLSMHLKWLWLDALYKRGYSITLIVAVPIPAKAISRFCEPHDMTVSMSRTANCYDNAVTEAFFHSFKGECIDQESFPSRAQARNCTFEYIETFYNRTRRHSTLQYMSPVIYEQAMC